MFYAVSKIFWFFAEPVAFLVLVALVGSLLTFTRYARTGRIVALFACLGLVVCLLTPVGALLLRPLETRFPAPGADIPEPTGIIVLGGAISSLRSDVSGQVVLASEASRLTAGVELAQRYPRARLIFTGGSESLWQDVSSEADLARRLWRGLGVPDERMLFETRSLNTWQNALFTRALVAPQPGDTFLLVTSAWHMPRSVGIFRRLGFEVVAYPVAQRTLGGAKDWLPHTTIVDRLFMLDMAVKEWIGLSAYWLTGKTDALFPGPLSGPDPTRSPDAPLEGASR